MERVLITGGRAPAALELARQFAAAGVGVVVADSAPFFLTRSSRAVERAFRVPPPRQAPRAFADAIAAIARREKVDLIVPTCEEVFYLGRFAEEISKHAVIFSPDFAALNRLHNKWTFTQMAGGLGVEIPQTWLLRTPQDIADLADPPEHLVFKPVYSRFAAHTLITPRRQMLAQIQPSVQRPWVAQRYIAGRELCSYSVARGGRLTAHAVYYPTWRAGRGSGFYFTPAASPAIESFITRFIAKLAYTGQIAFDFIEAADGTTHVLECNPRATSGVHLFDSTHGGNLARAFTDATGGIVRPGSPRPGMLGAAMLFLGPIQAIRQGRLRRLARDFAAGRDGLWSWSDPVPSIYIYLGLGAFLVSAGRRRITPAAASTLDIQWDGQEIP